jgi:hypothetical protein
VELPTEHLYSGRNEYRSQAISNGDTARLNNSTMLARCDARESGHDGAKTEMPDIISSSNSKPEGA